MAVAEALIPFMAFSPVAAGALRSPIRLFEILNVVPVVRLSPLTIAAAVLPDRS